jgi:dolichyl-phosphate beta-glucosyltransferase
MQCTIVVPCYNERSRLDKGAFDDFVRDHKDTGFLFVNDGSTDGTRELLDDLVLADPQRMGVLHLERNCGKAEAVRRGILECAGLGARYAGFWDADLATPLNVIPEFIHHLDAYPDVQMVFGARVRLLGRRIDRRPLRHYLGRGFATAASLVLGVPFYDTQCGAKVFRMTPEVVRIFESPFRSRWIFDVEIVARYLHRSHSVDADTLIHEMPLHCWRDVAGSKVKPRDFARAFWELLDIYRTYRRTRIALPSTAGREPAEVVVS